MAIVKKGPDKWQVAVDLGRDSAGKRRRVTKTVRGPRSEAVRAEANLRNQSAQWSPDTGGRTVADLLDEWLNRRPGTLSPTTTAEYRRIARSRIVPEFGARDVDSIRRRDLDDFYGRLLAGGLSPNSVRQVHAVIRRAYVHGERWGWCRTNPAVGADVPKQRRALIAAPTDDTIRSLVQAADADEAHGLGVSLRVLSLCGLRRGEMLGLQLDDIDLDRGELMVRRNVVYVRGTGTVTKEPKTHQQRALPIADALAGPLGIWLDAIAARASRVGVERPLWVFSPSATHGRPWSPNGWHNVWSRTRASVGAESVRLHDLRHWFVTSLLDDGVGGPTVAAMAGHESVNTTHRVYAHRVDASARRGVDGLGDRF